MPRDITRPWVLGVGASHNGAVCLLHGDEIVVAIQLERLVRLKRARQRGASESQAIRYCLEYAGITPADLSIAVLACSGSNNQEAEDLTLNAALQLSRHEVRYSVVGHHMAHAIGAFATSGFDDAALLVVDGSGSPWQDLSKEERDVADVSHVARYTARGRGQVMETVSMYLGQGTSIRPVCKHVSSQDLRVKAGMQRFWSLGYLYEEVADQIFGDGLDAAGKMMGLAPYGTPTTRVSDFYSILNGHFEFLDTVPNRYLHNDRWPMRGTEYQNLAASAQRALEDALFVLVQRLYQLTGAKRVCYAGGVALNSVANDLLVKNGPFEEFFIMPAAEDSGTAIGAAYYGLWQLTGRNGRRRLLHDAVGRAYTEPEIADAIERCPAVLSTKPRNIIERAVDSLESGKILGWFQGRSELGPRALGQRSIVCDPRGSNMKQVLNSTVKFREEFRPFAPAILLQHVSAYFDATHGVESPFMLRVVPVREDARASIPAVVHVDGTGRVQTLTKEANGRFYELVECFYRRTGCPVLLNTSFNIAGEPIVETPADALNCLLWTGLDACVLEDWLVVKEVTYRSPLDLVPKLIIDRVQWDVRIGYDHAVDRMASVKRSSHIDDRANAIGPWVTGSRHDVFRVRATTRWGTVEHIFSAGVYDILRSIDGQRTGWQILSHLQSEYKRKINQHELAKILALLRRKAVIEWRSFGYQQDLTPLSTVRSV